MASRSLRNRLGESTNIWPGFVDVLATLLIVIIFILMVFTVSQIYLSDAISGRDKALQELRIKISELSKILQTEINEKEEALKTLSETESNLLGIQKELNKQELISKGLQTDLAKKSTEIFVQEQNLLALSDQITELLNELRIVAKALEVYEGFDSKILNTEGLGERINKALARRIDQLKNLNFQLDETNQKLSVSEANLNQNVKELNLANEKLALTNEKLSVSEANLNQNVKELNLVNEKLALNENTLEDKIAELEIRNNNLLAINESLGLEEAGIVDQINAIKAKNQKLEKLNKDLLVSQKETQETLNLLEQTNLDLALRDEELQNQINQYQDLMKDLLKINNSLGLKDATLQEQLEAIRFRNQELARLNQNLINKDNTIFDLRGKIIELNNVLSISEDNLLKKEGAISRLKTDIEDMKSTRTKEKEISQSQIMEMELQASKSLEQISNLSSEIENLKIEILTLNKALEASEIETASKNLEIEILGERLNKALTSQIFELQKYRSEFFGKLQSVLGDRDDIKIVGDRFIFESELLFDSASANLQTKGKDKLKEIAIKLMETTNEIPTDIDWIIQVEGHTDKRPINTIQFPSNWELSTARANSVLKLLLEIGFSPNRLAAAGYVEFFPISDGETKEDYQQNRRIELKLTSR